MASRRKFHAQHREQVPRFLRGLSLKNRASCYVLRMRYTACSTTDVTPSATQRRTSDEFQSPRNDFEHVAHFQAAGSIGCDRTERKSGKKKNTEDEKREGTREREREVRSVRERVPFSFAQKYASFVCHAARSACSLVRGCHARCVMRPLLKVTQVLFPASSSNYRG